MTDGASTGPGVATAKWAVETVDLAYAWRGHRGRRGLAGVSLTAGAGEIVGLLGPNGAGKSTLVRVVSGVLPGYTGEARVDGREVRSTPPRELARRVAVVPQEPVFDPLYTVLEVVLLGRHPHLEGLAFESERDVELAREALARVGAESLAERPIGALSAGERQRVVFARALAQSAGVLLLDEAASFLDLRYQVELYDRVRELARDQGVAVVAVLHDLNLAAEYCDRVVLLKDGAVAATGPTAEVLTYAHLKRVFETEIYVDVHDLTGALVIIPLSGRVRARLGGDRT